MVKLLYIIAAIFIITWVIGFFVYSLGAIIHLLLVLAVIIVLIRFFHRKNRVRKARPESVPRDRYV